MVVSEELRLVFLSHASIHLGRIEIDAPFWKWKRFCIQIIQTTNIIYFCSLLIDNNFCPIFSRSSPSNDIFRLPPPFIFCVYLLSLSYSVWPRPVHSEHQIRFAGRRYAAAAERGPGHSWWVIGAWKASPRSSLPVASSRPAHTTDLHPESELWRWESEPSCPRDPAPLPHAWWCPIAPRHASLHKPAGPRPHGTLLQPRQPGLSTRGLGQRPDQTQLCLNLLMSSRVSLPTLPFNLCQEPARSSS